MQLVTHKVLPPTVFPSLPVSKATEYAYKLGISFCPSMDLVATWPALTFVAPINTSGIKDMSDSENTNKKQVEDEAKAYGYATDDDEDVMVDVWRFNGQRVFMVTIGSEDEGRVEVEAIDWRHDGQIVAILSSDKLIRLVNSFNGKVVHRLSTTTASMIHKSPTSPRTRRVTNLEAATSSQISPNALSYSAHFSNPGLAQTLLDAATTERSISLDDVLSLNADINSLLKTPADLPRELANIDVESFLPKLSCLPPVGFGVEDIFSTRASIDAIFHTSKKNLQSGIVNVLLSGHHLGLVSARIFDSFEIGTIDLNAATGMKKVPQIGHINSITSHAFSSESFIVAQDVRMQAHLFSLDMRFISHSSNTLSILATKATQLQNLLRYLTQIQVQLAREVKTAFELPMRYLRNLDEDLQKQDNADSSFRTASYHAIVTGEISGAFKEWLNDQLGERGVKRWEKSVNDCYELVRRLVSESWCPAIERAGVVLSRLHGLSSWPIQNDDDRSGLGLNRRLIESLRDTVDVMAICGEDCLKDVIKEMRAFTSFIKWLKWEVEASGLEDTSEKLDEMREGSEHGEIMNVLEYIDRGPQESLIKRYISSSSPIPEDEKGDEAVSFYESFRKQKRRQSVQKEPPAFDHLLHRMRKQCDNLFSQIAETLCEGVTTSYLIQLETSIDTTIMAVRVISKQETTAHIIARRKTDATSILHQIINTDSKHRGNRKSTTCIRSPPATEVVLDIKFVDDNSYMVLVKTSNCVCIYSHPIEAQDEDEWELRHTFSEGVMEAGMKPARLEVNGRKRRRVVGVVDEGGKGYVILDLDSGDMEESPVDKEMTG